MKRLIGCLLFSLLTVSVLAKEKKIEQYSAELVKKAEGGDATAQCVLGGCYQLGSGVVKNEKEAVKWYIKSAEKGNAEAQWSLALCYVTGSGISKDEKEAAKWYKKSAEQGDPVGQCGLGACYAKGIGVSKDEKEAVRWLTKSADQGVSEAKALLGLIQAENDAQKILKDVESGSFQSKKEELFKKLLEKAESGDASSQKLVGNCYFKGDGVSKDEKVAVKWLRKSAEQGNSKAQADLGACYFSGRGVPVDEAEGFKWSKKAAEQGDPAAQCNLGFKYFEGKGVHEDKKEALKWFRKASEQGIIQACSMLEVLKKENPRLDMSDAQAFSVRNPFMVKDVGEINYDDVRRFAASTSLNGSDKDENAEKWSQPKSSNEEAATIEGNWSSRWNVESAGKEWKNGKAQVKGANDVYFILYENLGLSKDNGMYLIECKMEKDLLIGKYVNLNKETDAGPWVGKIVNHDRIDGQWSLGRWDFRR
jgi:TPR repeat protein